MKVIPTPVGTTQLNNVAIPPSYTLGLEAGYFVTPNWTLAISAGVPPEMHIKATAFNFTQALGTDLVGSVRFGPLMGLLQYHFTQWGAFQPYVGAGAAYVVMFANTSDGILSNFSVDPTFCAVAQAGFDYMLTGFGLPNWGDPCRREEADLPQSELSRGSPKQRSREYPHQNPWQDRSLDCDHRDHVQILTEGFARTKPRHTK